MEYGRQGGLHRRGNVEKQRKTVQNSDFGAKTTVIQLKIQIFEFQFEFRASWCITNLKRYIYEASAEYGRRGRLHTRENVEKQRKTAQNSDFGAKTTVTAQNSKI